MDLGQLIPQMARQAESIHSLAYGISEDQALWKPAVESWSILEVVNHLYDEEREDFRQHLDDILHHPDQPWHPIDPQGWVTQRRYNQRDLEESLGKFMRERELSLEWLRNLQEPDWQAERRAPWGAITAGDILAAWVAHDLLHLRQLIELHWVYTGQVVQPYDVRYAGEW